MTYAEVIKYFGNVINAAKALDVTRQAVYLWEKNGNIPKNRQKYIQFATRNKLKADK